MRLTRDRINGASALERATTPRLVSMFCGEGYTQQWVKQADDNDGGVYDGVGGDDDGVGGDDNGVDDVSSPSSRTAGARGAALSGSTAAGARAAPPARPARARRAPPARGRERDTRQSIHVKKRRKVSG